MQTFLRKKIIGKFTVLTSVSKSTNLIYFAIRKDADLKYRRIFTTQNVADRQKKTHHCKMQYTYFNL